VVNAENSVLTIYDADVLTWGGAGVDYDFSTGNSV
jgi:hypothetical protein